MRRTKGDGITEDQRAQYQADSQAWTAERLKKVQARAAMHNAGVSVRGDGALELWLPAIKGDD